MKLSKRIYALGFATLTALALLSGCGKNKETEYTVEKRDFYYSIDNGATYGNERYELEVGQTVLMKVLVTVTTNKEEKEEVTGTISIPKIDAIDAYYVRGQKMTPTVDNINNITSYNFTITTNEDWAFIFEFKPNAAAPVPMELLFDPPIPERYNVINTIKFVEQKTSSSEQDQE